MTIPYRSRSPGGSQPASPEQPFSHFEIDVRRPEGWVELGADRRKATRKFYDADEVRRAIAVLEEDGFKTLTLSVDETGKRTTCWV